MQSSPPRTCWPALAGTRAILMPKGHGSRGQVLPAIRREAPDIPQNIAARITVACGKSAIYCGDEAPWSPIQPPLGRTRLLCAYTVLVHVAVSCSRRGILRAGVNLAAATHSPSRWPYSECRNANKNDRRPWLQHRASRP